MGRFKSTVLTTCAALLCTAGLAGAQGVLPDRATFVTLSGPVSVPGVVLPAGEYLFRIADSQASRHIVQIFDRDRSKIFATLIAVAAERNEPSDESVITFRETPADQAPALRYWYYPGEKRGQEFVYPKSRAVEIARASGESVLAVDASSEDFESMSKGAITRVDPKSADVAAAETKSPAAAVPAESAQAAAPAATPAEPATPESTQAAAPAQPAEPAAPAEQPAAPAERPAESPQASAQAPPTTGSAASQPQPTGTSGRDVTAADRDDAAGDRELPRTASRLPLVGLVGFLALGGALGAHLLRRRLVS